MQNNLFEHFALTGSGDVTTLGTSVVRALAPLLKREPPGETFIKYFLILSFFNRRLKKRLKHHLIPKHFR